MQNRDIKIDRHARRVLRIRISLPPLKMYCFFYNASLLRNIFSAPSQIETDLKGDSEKGGHRPRNKLLNQLCCILHTPYQNQFAFFQMISLQLKKLNLTRVMKEDIITSQLSLHLHIFPLKELGEESASKFWQLLMPLRSSLIRRDRLHMGETSSSSAFLKL